MKGAFISCLWGSTKRQGLGLDGNRFLSPSTAIANWLSQSRHSARPFSHSWH